VICGLSGGVDSSVAAVLIHEAIGDQLTCVFVDHGLMRKDEASQVVDPVPRPLQHPARPCRCARTVPRRAGRRQRPRDQAQDHRPPVHRRVRGEAKKIGRAREFLAQGTLYPDVIESVSLHRRPVGHDQEPPQCRRPARAHEHEAGRAAARTVQGRGARARPRAGPARAFVGRHPFPGPGLAIRSPARSPEKLDILRKADAIYLDEIRKAGLYDKIWQAFAVLLPVQTVGVMGDGRTYDFVCALRAVTSVDGMTADFYPLRHGLPRPHRHPHHQRGPGVNRVVYDVTSKPPGTIEWEYQGTETKR
jgi:GMP synthase (glutamine-hydrolysing)